MFEERMLEFSRIREFLASRCVSDLGRRRVADMTPQSDREAIERDRELVREMMGLLEQRREPPIHTLRDVAAHVGRVARERAVLEPAELLDVKAFLETAGRLRRFFEAEAARVPRLAELTRALEPLPALQRSIDEKIAPNATVRDTASEALRLLRREIFACEQRIQNVLQRMIRELTESGDLQDDFYTLRNNRYVLPVKTSNRNRVPGLIHDSSNTGETVFIEPYAILEDSNRLSELRVKEREEIFRILLRVAGHMRDELPALQTNLAILAELDSIYARARFGCDYGGTFPTLATPDRPLRLVEAHHPLLRVANAEHSRPLSLILESANKVLVVTGPNAGGKTTALKTIGLTVLMTQCAIPVPVDPRSVVPVYGDVLADIGDEQDVLEGVSTFSAHMQRIARILREAGRGSLVLLDELGTATDPGEGGALAVAILERLAESAALTVVSTHLAALKNWAAQHPAGRNASFRLSERDRRPTFHLVLDVPGISEALVIAEQVGLPRAVIERARALRPTVESDVSALVARLQTKEEELDRLRAELAQEKEQLEVMRVMLDNDRRQLEQERRRLKRELLAETEAAVQRAKARVEELVASQPSKAELEKHRRELQRQLEDLRQEQRSLAEPVAIDPSALRKGVRVHLRTLRDWGTVVEWDSGRSRLRVAIGGKFLVVGLEEVDAVEEAPAPSPSAGVVVKRARRDMQYSIDLHGQRVDEALVAVQRHIDDALMSGLRMVRIVHGFGTGALRRAIHDYLRQQPHVKKFYPEQASEGGAGATIVELE